jgi:MFS family permease
MRIGRLRAASCNFGGMAMKLSIRVHADVLKLGLVSLLTDVSSELIFSVFAILFTTVAGASSALLGLIEGLADLSASSLDYAAGWLSDETGGRKSIALAGYGFSTLAKTLPLISSSIIALSAFRVLERMGKSVRGPPRDAWLAAIAEEDVRGYSFGVHKALDKGGAIVGPLIGYALLLRLGPTTAAFRTLFWVALIPALLSVLLLGLIKERVGSRLPPRNILSAWTLLGRGFKRYLIASGIFSLAYFSFGFLLLRAQHAGFALRDVVLLYALFNASFVVAAPFVGKLGDLIGRSAVVASSYVIYLIMSAGFAVATAKWEVVLLFVLYGVFYSIDEAQSKAFIADLEPERRATAIGIYNFTTGLVYLPASLIAGALWTTQPTSAFALAAVISAAAFVSFLMLRPARLRP